MHCRAYLLLERELNRLKKNPLWGISVSSSVKNNFCWHATISGLRYTPWEHGRFHITLLFDENYDNEQPSIRFNTIPFHPNIDPVTGEPCLDLFNQAGADTCVNFSVTISSVLLTLQNLLSNPVLENPINPEAANLLKNSPHIYMQLVKNCVSESRNLTEILFTQDFETDTKTKIISTTKAISSVSTTSTRRPKQVSFDMYYRNWVELGTSQASPFITALKLSFRTEDDSSRMVSPFHEGSVTNSARKVIAMETEHKMSKLRQKKMERISAMKQLYINKKEDSDVPGSTAPVSSLTDVAGTEKNAEGWEKEADELVAWTASLEEGSL